MNYYDSAEGEIIAKKRALQELKNHGIDDAGNFFADCGNHKTYDAQAVLRWLGY